MFARQSAVAGKTLQVSQKMTYLTAVLSNALERGDDAYLLAVSGARQQAGQSLQVQRKRFAIAFVSLLQTISQPDEQRAAWRCASMSMNIAPGATRSSQ